MYKGFNLSFVRSVVVIVIGVLNFVVFFKNVLNENLIKIISRWWLFVIDNIDVWIILNWFVFIEILYKNIDIMII